MYGPTQKIQPCARASMHVCVHTAKCVASKEGPVCTKAAELSKTTGLRNTVVATMWQIQGRDTTHACVGGGLQSCTHDSLRSARGDIPPPERAVTHYARTAVCTRFVYVCVCVCVCGCVWCPLRGQGRPEICLKWDSGVLDRCIPQYSWCIPHRTCESRVPGGGTIQNYCRSGGNLVLPFDTLVRSGPPCSSCGCLCFRKSLTSRKMEGLRSEKKTGMHRLLCWRSDMLYWEREWA
mmetsp:Transcript_58025/g.96080  ORF Transcript_58025/g.96080 Transcript_58025/m.96080 type:complete len:236 (+) Transcript_58025:668-1375(+)